MHTKDFTYMIWISTTHTLPGETVDISVKITVDGCHLLRDQTSYPAS